MKLNHKYKLSDGEQVEIIRDVVKPKLHEHVTIIEKTESCGSYEAARRLKEELDLLREVHEVKHVLIDDLFLSLDEVDDFDIYSKLMSGVNLGADYLISYFDCYADENLYSFPEDVIKENLIEATRVYHDYLNEDVFRAIFYNESGFEVDSSELYYGKSGLGELIKDLGIEVKEKYVYER